MKKPKLLNFLLFFAGLLTAQLSFSQTDYTSQITNPSFETGDYTGWTWTGWTGGWQTVNNDGDATKDGTYIAGHWNSSIEDIECSQVLSALPNGYYKITALASVSTNRSSNQRLFVTTASGTKSMLYGASDNTAYSAANLAILGATETYSFGGYAESTAENGPFYKLSVVNQVTDSTLTLGFRFSGNSTTLGYDFSYSSKGDVGFFKFDNFTLTEVSSLATLDAITLSEGALDSTFDSNTFTYTASLPVGTETVTPSVVLSVEGTTVTGLDAVDVSSGSGTSTITVTALDGTTTQVYTINYTVLELSNDATLSDLTVSVGTLSPAFDPADTIYTVLLPIGTATVTATATVNDILSTVTGDGEVTLDHGRGTSAIVVTAEDGTTKSYLINYDFAYITNPSFETADTTGWSFTGADSYVWIGVNSDGDATKDGTYICGIWNSAIGDVELSQTLTGIPDGKYMITADLMGSSNSTTSRLTTQRLFAGGSSMLFGADTAYSAENLAILGATEVYSFGGYTETQSDTGPFRTLSVTVSVTADTLKMGVRTNGSASTLGYTFSNLTAGDGYGWFKVDNFTMTYIGIPDKLQQVNDQDITYSVIDGKLIVKNTDSFVVYNLQGMKVADVRDNSGNGVALRSGIYIVKAIDRTFKVLVNK